MPKSLRTQLAIGDQVLHPDDPNPGIIRGFAAGGMVLVEFQIRGVYGHGQLDDVDPRELEKVNAA